MTGATTQVEREARQLVEAAARWLAAVPDSSAAPDNTEYAARTVDLEGDAKASAGSGVTDEQPDEQVSDKQVADGTGEHSEEHVCRGCPWCRAKAAAGPIGADTLDSLAHLLGTAAESLSLFAQSRREAAGEDDVTHNDATPDDAVIDWDDEDEDEFRAGADEQPKQSPTKERRAR